MGRWMGSGAPGRSVQGVFAGFYAGEETRERERTDEVGEKLRRLGH